MFLSIVLLLVSPITVDENIIGAPKNAKKHGAI